MTSWVDQCASPERNVTLGASTMRQTGLGSGSEDAGYVRHTGVDGPVEAVAREGGSRPGRRRLHSPYRVLSGASISTLSGILGAYP